MFARPYRLRHEQEVKKVLDAGRARSGKFMLYKYLKNDLGKPRFTVIAGKKVSPKAVVRNRKKRQVREMVWQLVRNGAIVVPVDAVLVLRKEIRTASAQEIRKDICGILGVKSCD